MKKQDILSLENQDELIRTLADFHAKLLIAQEPLGREFEQVLQDNFWDLLVTDDPKKGKHASL
jgi:hypothetical protein